jgi:hypothetical protein
MSSMSESVPPKESAAAPGVAPPHTVARSRANLWPWLATVAVMATAAFQLRMQGRFWWCACGQLYLWWGDTRSAHTSQHLLDPYSFTHVLHGVVLCGLLVWGIPRLSPPWRFCLAVSLESLWEVLENTGFIIQRYRAATLALGYEGDTIVNSLGDVLSAALGYALARRLGFRASLALFAAIDLALLIWIRDSLVLNIVMLIHPIEAIKAWQLAR